MRISPAPAATLLIAGLLTLTSPSEADEWRPLFNGRDLTGWAATGKPGAWTVEDGAIACAQPGSGGYLHTVADYGDFVLSLEFKLSPPVERPHRTTGRPETVRCNSGVFVRWSDLANPTHTGLEVQLFDSFGVATPGKHDAGAFYDMVAPTKNTVKVAGEWNRIVITARGPHLSVELNGEAINAIDLDAFDQPRRNPDGSVNKFRFPWKDLPRRGHIGLQDHGDRVWFRDVKIREAPSAAGAFRIESERNTSGRSTSSSTIHR